jgi:hypothetical protein
MGAPWTDVFVIRIWFEPVPGERGGRRGYVEHVATRQRRYFLELTEALDFVAALAGHPAPGPPRDDVPPSELR